VIALFANSAVDRTDDGLPWEITLAGFCVFAVVFCAIYAKRTEVALSIISVLLAIVPTYYVHNYEVPCKNWDLGSTFPLKTDKSTMLNGIWSMDQNASRFDKMLPLGLTAYKLSLFPPGVSIEANTSEIYHSGIKLDDPITKQKTHDYLLLSSPRKVKGATTGIMLLIRVPVALDLWPEGVEDYTFNLQTASNIIAPPTITGELLKLDKGPAIEHLQKKHNLRPFLLDVYKIDYHFGDR